jgi:hypothetical protein
MHTPVDGVQESRPGQYCPRVESVERAEEGWTLAGRAKRAVRLSPDEVVTPRGGSAPDGDAPRRLAHRNVGELLQGDRVDDGHEFERPFAT